MEVVEISEKDLEASKEGEQPSMKGPGKVVQISESDLEGAPPTLMERGKEAVRTVGRTLTRPFTEIPKPQAWTGEGEFATGPQVPAPTQIRPTPPPIGPMGRALTKIEPPQQTDDSWKGAPYERKMSKFVMGPGGKMVPEEEMTITTPGPGISHTPSTAITGGPGFSPLEVTPQLSTLREEPGGWLERQIPKWMKKTGLTQEDKAKAAMVIATAEELKLPPSFVEANWDKMTKEMGIRGVPTREELFDFMMKAGIAAGFVVAPIATTIGLGTYMATKEAESLGTQALRGEKPKLLAGRELKEFLGPLKEPYASMADALEFLAPGALAAKFTGLGREKLKDVLKQKVIQEAWESALAQKAEAEKGRLLTWKGEVPPEAPPAEVAPKPKAEKLTEPIKPVTPTKPVEPAVTLEELNANPKMANYVFRRPQIHDEATVARAKEIRAEVKAGKKVEPSLAHEDITEKLEKGEPLPTPKAEIPKPEPTPLDEKIAVQEAKVEAVKPKAEPAPLPEEKVLPEAMPVSEEGIKPAIIHEGKQIEGKTGGTHPDILAEQAIKPEELHERGFVTPEGEFLDRKEAKEYVKTNEPEVAKELQKQTGTGEELYGEHYNQAKEEVGLEPKHEKTTLIKNYDDFMQKLGYRLASEERGQFILDEMENKNVSPQQVNSQFWEKTYPKLNDEQKTFINKYIKKLTNLEPGSTLSYDPKTGDKVTAKNWIDIGKDLDLGFKASNLEGTERGLVSIMRAANERVIPKEVSDAVKEREKPKSLEREHPGIGEIGKASETGGRNSLQQSRQIEKEEKAKVKAPELGLVSYKDQQRYFKSSSPIATGKNKGKIRVTLTNDNVVIVDSSDITRQAAKGEIAEVKSEEKPSAVTVAKKPEVASKLRQSAESLTNQINEKRNPAVAQQNVTARRARQTNSAYEEADRLENLQNKLNALSDAHETGTVPESLSQVTTKAQVESILRHSKYPRAYLHNAWIKDILEATKGKPGTAKDREILSRVMGREENGGTLYGDREIEVGERLIKIAEKAGEKAPWAKDSIADHKRMLAAGIDTEEKFTQAKKDLSELGKKPIDRSKEQKIRTAEQALLGTKISGYFPTPKATAEKIVEMADIEPGMSVLEPSAGKGNMADVIKEQVPDADLKTIEWQTSLSDILKLKGYDVIGKDFLEHTGQYDRIIMNPPFENFQDVEHVRHAYNQLKPGGKLVSIMSESPFFRQDKKAVAFRDWLDLVNGTSEKLPEKSFAEKSERATGVSGRIVTIEKPKPEGAEIIERGKGTQLPNGFKIGQEVTFVHNGKLYDGYAGPSASLDHVFVVDKEGNGVGNVFKDEVSLKEPAPPEPKAELSPTAKDQFALPGIKQGLEMKGAKEGATPTLEGTPLGEAGEVARKAEIEKAQLGLFAKPLDPEVEGTIRELQGIIKSGEAGGVLVGGEGRYGSSMKIEQILGGLSAGKQETLTAIDKGLNGEKLGVRQQNIFDRVKESANGIIDDRIDDLTKNFDDEIISLDERLNALREELNVQGATPEEIRTALDKERATYPVQEEPTSIEGIKKTLTEPETSPVVKEPIPKPETFRKFVESQGIKWPIDAKHPEYEQLKSQWDMAGAKTLLADETGAVDLQGIAEGFKKLKDYVTIDVVPKLARGKVADTAVQHASARIAIPHIVDDLLAKVFPDQYRNPQEMAKTIDILNKDNVLGGYDDFLKRAEEADTAGDEKLGDKWDKAAQNVAKKHNLDAYEKEVRAAMKDPVISANIARWKEHVVPDLDRLYNEVKNVDPLTDREGRGRHLDTRINLLTKDKAVRWNEYLKDNTKIMPQSSGSNYRNPNVKHDPYDTSAKFTGDYSTDARAVLTNVYSPRWNEVTKIRFYNDLIEKGLAIDAEKGQETPEGYKRMPIKMPETNDKGVTRQLEKALFVKEDLVREVRDVLGTDQPLTQNIVARVGTGIQLAQIADLVTHLKNIQTVITKAQGAGAWEDVVRKMPVLGSLDAVKRIATVTKEVLADTPEIRAEIAEMAKRGFVRPEFPSTGFQRITRGQEIIHQADTASRIIMNRFFDNLVERGLADPSEANRRKFVNQIGNYNKRLMGPIMRAASQMGLSPFIVAGRTFNRQGRWALTGNPGVEATSANAAFRMRMINFLGLVSLFTLPMMLNMITTGEPGGRSGTPLGAWDFGGKKDEKGKHKVLDLLQITGVRRGMRSIGLDSAIEGIRQRKDTDQIVGQMTNDILSAASHPWLGPAAGGTFKALTGKQLDLRGQMKTDNPNPALTGYWYLENFRAALESQNPLLYSASRPIFQEIGLDSKPDKPYLTELGKTFLKSPFQAFGVRDIQKGMTAFETFAMNLPSKQGGLKKDQAHTDLVLTLANDIRQGAPNAHAKLNEAHKTGKITDKEKDQIKERAKETPKERIKWEAKRMTVDELARGWTKATKEEKKILKTIFDDKIYEAYKDEKITKETKRRYKAMTRGE